jgi:Holliday junction DNA helicase RuvB
MRSAKVLETPINYESAKEIAMRCRSTPRIANFYLKRVRDYSEVHNVTVDPDIVRKCLEMLEVDSLGLGKIELDYLNILNTKFSGGPTGLSTLSAALSEEEATLEDVIEPYLIQLGFIEKTTRGRTLTDAGKLHISK